MRLNRRGEFIFMLIVNNFGGVVPRMIFVSEPDALWLKKALYCVVGLLFLSIGNWFVVDSWGPNSWNAKRERELMQRAAERRRGGHREPVRLMTALLTAGLLAPGASVVAASVPTPAAMTMNVVIDDGATRVRGFVVDFEGMEWRLGVVIVCDGTAGRLEAHLAFGPFPADRPVQAAVLAADGTAERFGPVVETEHGALSGFHAPVVEGRDDVLRLMAAAFTEGALVSNGWRSVWNRIPAADNARAREDILECVGT